MGRTYIVLDTAFIHEMIPIPSSCAKTGQDQEWSRSQAWAAWQLLLIDIDGWLLPPVPNHTRWLHQGFLSLCSWN